MFASKLLNLAEQQGQKEKQALIKLAIFFYQIDKHFREGEQKYFDQWLRSLSWESGVSVVSFQSQCIAESAKAIDSNDDEVIKAFLVEVVAEIDDEVLKKTAVNLALDVVIADREYSDIENKWVEKLRLILKV